MENSRLKDLVRNHINEYFGGFEGSISIKIESEPETEPNFVRAVAQNVKSAIKNIGGRISVEVNGKKI